MDDDYARWESADRLWKNTSLSLPKLFERAAWSSWCGAARGRCFRVSRVRWGGRGRFHREQELPASWKFLSDGGGGFLSGWLYNFHIQYTFNILNFYYYYYLQFSVIKVKFQVIDQIKEGKAQTFQLQVMVE